MAKMHIGGYTGKRALLCISELSTNLCNDSHVEKINNEDYEYLFGKYQFQYSTHF